MPPIPPGAGKLVPHKQISGAKQERKVRTHTSQLIQKYALGRRERRSAGE